MKKVEKMEGTSEKIKCFDDLVSALNAKMEEDKYIPVEYKEIELDETKKMKKIKFTGTER